MITCKFGGKSTTNKLAINNIKKISRYKKRKIFVFSAIGKFYEKDDKMTDLLILVDNQNINEIFDKIKQKFYKLINLTNVKVNINYYLKKIKKKYLITQNKQYLISRGEYLTSLIMSKYLKIKFIPAENIMYLKNGQFDKNKISKKLKKLISKYNQIIVPGFYGIEDNNIVVFDRGGSDISGAILCKCANFSVYENYTDVDGIKEVNPVYVKQSKTIKNISYNDALIVTSYDANVLHKDVCRILKNTTILTKVKNIFNLKGPYTQIDKNIHRCNFVCTKTTNDKFTILIGASNVDKSSIMSSVYDIIDKQKNLC